MPSLLYKYDIVIALEEMHSNAVLSLLVFFCDVAVGVGASAERDQSAPALTAPHSRLRLNVCFFPLKSQEKKAFRASLSRASLLNPDGYYITEQSGMPVQQYNSKAGATNRLWLAWSIRR